MYIKQLLNSVLVGNEELLRPRFVLSAEAELKIYVIHIKYTDTMFFYMCRYALILGNGCVQMHLIYMVDYAVPKYLAQKFGCLTICARTINVPCEICPRKT